MDHILSQINPVHVQIVFKNNFNILPPSISINDTPDFKESAILARLASNTELTERSH
jgi:hypothetical protein